MALISIFLRPIFEQRHGQMGQEGSGACGPEAHRQRMRTEGPEKAAAWAAGAWAGERANSERRGDTFRRRKGHTVGCRPCGQRATGLVVARQAFRYMQRWEQRRGWGCSRATFAVRLLDGV